MDRLKQETKDLTASKKDLLNKAKELQKDIKVIGEKYEKQKFQNEKMLT
jgi:uncharacterized protein (UPF0335 family)